MHTLAGLLCVALLHLALGDGGYDSVCQSRAYGGEGGWGSSEFELRAPAGQRIEAIHLCATKDTKFQDHMAGFKVRYTDGTMSDTIGCNDQNDIYDPIILGEDEEITGVDIYHGKNNYWDAHVIQALSFHTTMTTHGPYGITEQAVVESVRGEKLIGLAGTAGYIIDNLSVEFERC